MNERLDKLAAAGIEVIAVSADTQDVAEKFVADKAVKFPIAFGLTVPAIRALGLYVSSPTNYISQTQQFSEPAFFLLTPDNKIKYAAVASFPMGGRVDVDTLLAGFNWSLANAKEHPEFASVVWGSA